MEDDIASDYDVIVVGTGMTESIVAAALSRIGKTVLHIDSNEYYGELWASFNFECLQTWIEIVNKSGTSEKLNPDKHLNESEQAMNVEPSLPLVSNVKQNWYCDSEKEDEVQTKWTIDKIKKEYRKFNLDLTPKLLYSRGPLVELLIKSNIARYAEFKCISRVLTWREGRLELVPCSRADVFATKNVSVVQKRLLVKLLSLCSDYPDNPDEFNGFEKKTFFEFLKHKKIPDNIMHYIIHAIAMCSYATPCLEGVEAVKSFLSSLGRYGNTPFLFPMYGSGEMPQCFCRLCAVFGGVYHLKRGVNSVIVNKEQCQGVVSGNQRFNCKHLVFSQTSLPRNFSVLSSLPEISRGIFVTDKSILFSNKEELTLLRYPPESCFKHAVTVLELGPGTHVCPSNLYVVHMTTEKVTNAEADLQHVIQALFNKEQASEEGEVKPQVLWSLTWNMSQGSKTTSPSTPSNIHLCSGPDLGLDFDNAIDNAREIFHKICPDEEFLPRAPDPDEIVFEGENQPQEDKKQMEETGKDDACLENEKNELLLSGQVDFSLEKAELHKEDDTKSEEVSPSEAEEKKSSSIEVESESGTQPRDI